MRFRQVSREFLGIDCGGEKRTSPLETVVVHQTGGPNARSGASFLHTRPDGSVHMVGDNEECYQLASRDIAACGVKDVNSFTWHYENGAPFSFRVRDWIKNWIMVNRCAWHSARILVLEGLPLHYLTTEDFNSGRKRGWTYHRNMSLSVISSSTHVDPVRWPHKRFSVLLRVHYLRFKFRGRSMRLEVVSGTQKVVAMTGGHQQ